MELKQIDIDSLNIKTKSYRVFFGRGVYLEVMPNGSKYWRLKYRQNGKENRLSLGVYPRITLNVAMDKCEEFKQILYEQKIEVRKKRIGTVR